MKSYYYEDQNKLVVTRYARFDHSDKESKAALMEVATFMPALRSRRSYSIEGVPGEWFLVQIMSALSELPPNDFPVVNVAPDGKQILEWDPTKGYYEQSLKPNHTEITE